MTAPTKQPDAEPTEAELPPPTNVIAAIARVMAEIGGIEKLTPRQRKARGMSGGDAVGIEYAYRGIDQLAQHAQPLFGKFGVVIVPNVVAVEIEPIVKGAATRENTTWTRTTVEVEWTLYGPGIGLDHPRSDNIMTVVHGVGDDNSDKGYNKAMTASFKNLLLRILCIGDPQDDPDARDENQPMPYVDPAPEEPFGKLLFDQIKASTDDRLKALLRQFAADNGKKLTEKALAEDEPWAHTVLQAIERYSTERLENRPEGGGEPATPGEGVPSGDPPPEEPKKPLGGAAKRGTARTVDEASEALQEQLGATEVKPPDA